MAIYNEYNDLMSVKGQSKTVVMEHLMNKYGIHSIGTIYVIRRRVEERQQAQIPIQQEVCRGVLGTESPTTERGNSHEENP